MGSPRLRSPRSNPFGFCFCFANPGRGPNLPARTHYAVEAGRPGLFKGLAAPAPWAFSEAARPEPGGAGAGAGAGGRAGAGLRGVRLSRGPSGKRRAAGLGSRVPELRSGRRLDGKFMVTATSTTLGFQGERRRARQGLRRGRRASAVRLRGPRRRPGPLPGLRREPAGACVPRGHPLPRAHPGPGVVSGLGKLASFFFFSLWPPASARGGGRRQVTGPPGAPSDRPAGLGLNRAVSGGRIVVVAVEVASLVSLTSGHPGGRRLSGSLAKLSGRFPRSPPVFAGGDFKEQQAGSFELRWRIIISFSPLRERVPELPEWSF